MATLETIAAAAKVSPNTVSRALQPGAVYRRPAYARRAERIRELASKMGYRPNVAAQSVASGRFNSVGLLLGTGNFSSVLPPPMLRGIHDALSERQMHLVMSILPDTTLTDEQALPAIIERALTDGVLVDYTHEVPVGLEAILDRYRIPATWINRRMERDAAFADELAAGRLVTQHLLQLGHRRIVYVDMSHGEARKGVAHYSAADRLHAYQAEMEAAGLTPQVWRSKGESVDEIDRPRWMVDRLRAEDRPTAVICYSHVGFAYGAAKSLGLTWPRDISIVGFDEVVHLRGGLEQTCLIEPRYEVGVAAIEQLLHRIDRGTGQPARAVVGRLHVGQTAGPAPV